MHRKGAQDLKKAKAFSRASKEIIVAVRSGGTDEDFNPRLRSALVSAKKVNLPKEKIDYAIKKATNQVDKTAYEEIIYEGYGPEGIGIIIETLTDNRNRTASDVRACFSRHSCVMSSQGGVSYLFDRVVEIIYQIPQIEQDNFYNKVIELDILDYEQLGEESRVICDFNKFSKISSDLTVCFGYFTQHELKWRPRSEVSLNVIKQEKALKLIKALDLLEDTQRVNHTLQLK